MYFIERYYPIPGWEAFYEISERGNVRSLRKANFGQILTHTKREGYFTVTLSKRGKSSHHRVHRLLAMTFLPNPGNKPFVTMIDGNRANYSIQNLKWVTAAELVTLAANTKCWKEILSILGKNTVPPEILRNLIQCFRIKPTQIIKEFAVDQ